MTWDEIRKAFENALRLNPRVQSIMRNPSPTYREANRYSIIVGDTMGKIVATKKYFPDGISYEDAFDTLEPALTHSYNLSKDMAIKAQKNINRKAGLNLNPAIPKPKPGLIAGLAKEIADRGGIDGFEAKFADQIGRFTMNGVDDTVSVNAYETQALGLAPKVVREAEPECCEWCADLEGEYTPNEAEALGVYRRHDNCRCTVEYVIGNVSETVHTGKEGKIKWRKDENGRSRRIEDDQRRQKEAEAARTARIAREKLAGLSERK